eukprot:13257467-Ditylum_brightwellii.AAC.1
MLGFLRVSIDDVLTLEADDSQTLTWHIDASFTVHVDMKSHIGAMFTLGKGAISSNSTKQKVNACSTSELELVSVDDKIGNVIWTKKFIEYQGFTTKLNIVYQDNESTLKLARNCKESSDDMTANYMSKPVVGEKFRKFRNQIMNLE